MIADNRTHGNWPDILENVKYKLHLTVKCQLKYGGKKYTKISFVLIIINK